MNHVSIRDFESPDLDAVVRIATTAWEPVFTSFRNLLGRDMYKKVYPDWRADKENQMRSAARPGSPVHIISAEAEHRVVGFASFVLDDKTQIGEIGNNAVDPDYQNRGIAGMLYAEVLNRMKDAGMQIARVSTGLDDSHAPARSAYKKAGFQNSIPSTTYFQKL